MQLTDVWFVLIAVLWTGYFVLEGFDFGVGMLLPILGGRDEARRRLLINTIGPVWDGNEVWLLVAGGATFAAFPEWYASLFSGFYLALLVIVVALIIRGVAFEYRGKVDSPVWRRRWDLAIIVGSAVPALLWGVAFGNIVRGVKLDAGHHYVGSFFDLLNPYALLAGLVTLTLFATHGAIFLALKTDGPVRAQARGLAARVGALCVALAAAFLLWTQLSYGRDWTWASAGLAAVALVGALLANLRGREGWAFLATAVTIVGATVTLFGNLYPHVLPSTVDESFGLTVTNAASTPYTLKIMTWVAAFFTPVVLAYQAWTYWVFRKRLTVEHLPAPSGLPVATLAPPRQPAPSGRS
jgi:cytochrome d ubiquinol oxidase subunit II